MWQINFQYYYPQFREVFYWFFRKATIIRRLPEDSLTHAIPCRTIGSYQGIHQSYSSTILDHCLFGSRVCSILPCCSFTLNWCCSVSLLIIIIFINVVTKSYRNTFESLCYRSYRKLPFLVVFLGRCESSNSFTSFFLIEILSCLYCTGKAAVCTFLPPCRANSLFHLWLLI